jgi:Arc/MetJ-type ribon-helix-helix transcriptional regulator
MSETEKITINMSVVDLGKIDLLVQEGFYQNRTDFIRSAIRSQLDKHEPAVQSSVVRNAYGMGIFGWGRNDLEKAVAKGERRSFNVIGMLVIESDVTPELADQAIESIRVRGVFRASDAVKEVLKDRIR